MKALLITREEAAPGEPAISLVCLRVNLWRLTHFSLLYQIIDFTVICIKCNEINA